MVAPTGSRAKYDARHFVERWLRVHAPAILGLWLICGAASALDCWVPTIDTTQAAYRKKPLPNMRGVVMAAEQMVRDNPHFKAMPRPIRIRSQWAVGPSFGQLNTHAYQPDVWEGTCGLVQGADRCCRDGGINVMINAPESFLFNVYGKDEQLSIFKQPHRTGTVAGYPEYEGKILMSVNGRVPWLPVTVGELLDFMERRERASQEEALRNRPAVYGVDPQVVQKTYENMKKIDPKSAEQFRANMEAQMAQLAEEHRKRTERSDQLAAERLARIQQTRASLTPQQLAAQAYHGNGPLNLGRADDPLSYPLAKPDPSFPDRADPDRVQLISVFVSIVEKDSVPERRNTMQRTKETLDYARLEKFLR